MMFGELIFTNPLCYFTTPHVSLTLHRPDGVVKHHTEFNRLAFGIDLDGNPLPGDIGCIYRGLDIISSRKYEEMMGSTSNDHPQYQRTTAPDGQTVIVSASTKQNGRGFEGCHATDKIVFQSIYLLHMDENKRKIGQRHSFQSSYVNNTG